MTQNSGKHYTWEYSFILKDINQNKPNEERVPDMELPCPFSVESVYVTLQNTDVFANKEAPLSLGVLRVYWSFIT